MFIVSASNPLAWILDINQLTETNHIDWLTNLRIIFNLKKNKFYQIILILTVYLVQSQRAILDEWMDNDNKDRYYMLKSMLDEL